MRIGIDSYSYHRLLGEVRAGEATPAGRFGRGSLDVLAEARRLRVDVVSLETVFLPGPGRTDADAIRTGAGDAEVVLAWGHPDGLVWGRDTAAIDDLLAWIAVAPRLGARLVRMVVASPRHPRPAEAAAWLESTAPAVARALSAAGRAGVRLCVENHADLRAVDAEALIEACPGLGVCLDTANALRVGDDPVDAARRLRDHVAMVHLKDCSDGDGGDPVAGPTSVPYGEGVVDVEGVLDALGDRLAGLPVCVELAQLPSGEVDERELVAADVRWLQAWRAARGRAGGENEERPVATGSRADDGRSW